MKVFDLSNETVVFRFREILIAAALNDVAQSFFDAADGNVVVSPRLHYGDYDSGRNG